MKLNEDQQYLVRFLAARVRPSIIKYIDGNKFWWMRLKVLLMIGYSILKKKYVGGQGVRKKKKKYRYFLNWKFNVIWCAEILPCQFYYFLTQLNMTMTFLNNLDLMILIPGLLLFFLFLILVLSSLNGYFYNFKFLHLFTISSGCEQIINFWICDCIIMGEPVCLLWSNEAYIFMEFFWSWTFDGRVHV